MKKRGVFWIVIAVGMGGGLAAGETLDVEITAPTFTFSGDLGSIDTSALSTFLNDIVIADLEKEMEKDEDLDGFATIGSFSKGFADANSASVHVGSPFTLQGYPRATLGVSNGAAITMPSSKSQQVSGTEEIFSAGDAYFGLATQPLVVVLGINLERYLARTNAYISGGYMPLVFEDKGSRDEVIFNSLTFGAGLSFRLIKDLNFPFGTLVWRGLSVGAAAKYARTYIRLNIPFDEVGTFTQSITYQEAGIPQDVYEALDAKGGDTFATVEIDPRIVAEVTNSAVVFPLDLFTGLRVLWFLDFSAGIGVDFGFGETELEMGIDTDVLLEGSTAVKSFIKTKPGTARVTVRSVAKPSVLRIRYTTGVTLNLGPVRFDLPVQVMQNDDGFSLMVGLTSAFSW